MKTVVQILSFLLFPLTILAQPLSPPQSSGSGGTATNASWPTATYFVAPWGSDSNPGTNIGSPLATLNQACTNILNVQAVTPTARLSIYSMGGYNSNELTQPMTNIIWLPPNIGYDSDPGNIWVLTNNNDGSVGHQLRDQIIIPNQGDVINNLRIYFIDTNADTAWCFGGYHGVASTLNAYPSSIPQTNPCVVNNLWIQSMSGAVHFEQGGGGTSNTFITFNNPWILSQGQAFYSRTMYGSLTVNSPTFTITNWNPIGNNQTTKPMRVVDFEITAAGQGVLAINGGSFTYSDFNSTNAWPCAAFNGAVTSTAAYSNCIVNGLSLIPLCTNAASFDFYSGVGGTTVITNLFLMENVTRIDGQLLTETNAGGTVSMINLVSNVHSKQYPVPAIINPIISGGLWTNNNVYAGTVRISIGESALTSSARFTNFTLNNTAIDSYQSTNLAAATTEQLSFRMQPGGWLIATQITGTLTINSSSFQP